MRWKKLGNIFCPSGSNPLLYSHAANPLAIHLEKDVFRIFYSSRDTNNKSSVGFLDFDMLKLKVIYKSDSPAFTYGAENTFYSHGVSIGNMYQVGEESYILFMGWQVPESGHWRGDIGRLKVSKNKDLVLNPDTLFMGVDKEDAISLSYPWVMFHEGKYKMWYGSTISWSSENGEMIHAIKYATSDDAIHWQKHGIAIPFLIGDAQAFSRPTVLVDDKGYHIWYSYRSGDGTPYRIGYAHSLDGVNWIRKHNEVGIDVSESGWDSEMICYPFVFDHLKSRYMLYNGNSYGKTGFGIAILEHD